MTDATDLDEPTATVHDERWFRHHVLTRFFATAWWLVMLLITVSVANSWVSLARHRRPGEVAGVAIMMIVFIPIYREWPNWRRMWRMLRHST